MNEKTKIESLAKESKEDIINSNKPLIKKRNRIPLREQGRLLGLQKEPGYAYHLVTDEESKPERMLKAGWEFVDKNGKEIEESKRTSDPSWKSSVLSQHVGGGKIGYMMRIPQEWKNEEDKKIQQEIEKQEIDCGLKPPYDAHSSKEEKERAIRERKYGEMKIDHGSRK